MGAKGGLYHLNSRRFLNFHCINIMIAWGGRRKENDDGDDEVGLDKETIENGRNIILISITRE